MRIGALWLVSIPLATGCFRVLPPQSHVFAPSDDAEASVCFDRCVEWTRAGRDEQAACLARCPRLGAAPGPCRGEPRCIDGERPIELDEETTLAAVELGARVTVLVVEAERKKAKKKRHPSAQK